jgi:hypothetical protein
MTILDIAARLEEFDKQGTIFAVSNNGAFTPESEVIVLSLDQDERNRSAAEISVNCCPGLAYCLEMSIAKDSVRIWSQWRNGRVPSAREAAEAICYKATNDAWGPPNW